MLECILEWFSKDHVTQKTGVMAAKIQFFHHRNKSVFSKLEIIILQQYFT